MKASAPSSACLHRYGSDVLLRAVLCTKIAARLHIALQVSHPLLLFPGVALTSDETYPSSAVALPSYMQLTQSTPFPHALNEIVCTC